MVSIPITSKIHDNSLHLTFLESPSISSMRGKTATFKAGQMTARIEDGKLAYLVVSKPGNFFTKLVGGLEWTEHEEVLDAAPPLKRKPTKSP